MSDIATVIQIAQKLCSCLYNAMPQCDNSDPCRGLCGVGKPDLDVLYALGCFLEKHWGEIFSYNTTYGNYRRTEHLRFEVTELAYLLIDSCDPEDREIWQKVLDFDLSFVAEPTLIADVMLSYEQQELHDNNIDNLIEFLSMAKHGECDHFDADSVLTVRFMAIETLKNLAGFLEKAQLQRLRDLMAVLDIDFGV